MNARLSSKHWIIIIGATMAVFLQIGGLKHGWADALTPTFVAGIGIQICKDILSLLTDAPRDPDTRTRDSDPTAPKG